MSTSKTEGVVAFGPHVERLAAVAATARWVAIGGRRESDRSHVHILSAAKLAAVAAMEVEGAVSALAFLGDDVLLAGTSTGRLYAWELGSAAPVARFEAIVHRGGVRGLAADPLGTKVLSVGDDGRLQIFAVNREAAPGTSGTAGSASFLASLAQRVLAARPLAAVAVDETGTIFATGGDDGILRVGSLDDGAASVREIACGEGGVRALAFTGDGRVAVGAGDSLRLAFVLGEADVQDRSRDDAHEGSLRALALGPLLLDQADRPTPRRVYSLGEDGALKAWWLDGKRKPRTLVLGGGAGTALAFVPPRKESAIGSLVAVSEGRWLCLVPLTADGGLPDTFATSASELERLAADLADGTGMNARAQSVRLAAVGALSALAEDEARILLERTLARDQAVSVRLAVAGKLTSRRASRPALRAALNDPDEKVRAGALSALEVLAQEAPLEAWRAALGSQHEDLRARAVAALPALATRSPLVPTLLADHLNDTAASVRRLALEALVSAEKAVAAAASGGAGASLVPRAALQVALARGPADVRAEAVRLLGAPEAGADDSARELLHAALDDADADVRSTAFAVAVRQVPRLAARLRERDPLLVRELAALEEKLGKLGASARGEDALAAETPLGEDELAPLFAALACRQPESALRGARGLALVGDVRAAGALLQLSREPSAALRVKVVEALGLAGDLLQDDRISARLSWLLDDAAAEVRAAAFETAARVARETGESATLELAAQALRTSHDDVRVRALQLLVRLRGDAVADALLTDALDDEASAVRSEAFRTLWAWHARTPELPLARGASSRHADIRLEVVAELARAAEKNKKASVDEPGRELLLRLVGDSVAEVGLAAYAAATKTDAAKRAAAPHVAAMRSTRPAVRAAGAKGAGGVSSAAVAEVRPLLVACIKDEQPEVHLAGIESLDKVLPRDTEGFALALGSPFYGLSVRAAELCGRRRDPRGVGLMKALLAKPKSDLDRPSDVLRERAARALADVGAEEVIPFFQELLGDEDPVVREMAARGLATACDGEALEPLVSALGHADLPVRSWAAEGLAKLGSPRALPVLAGTQRHEHLPIRIGALLGFAALGPEGVGGLRQGLDDPSRELQDLVFAIIVARDVALAEAGLGPDLLTSTLSSAEPEIRFAGARLLEARAAGEDLAALVEEMVGPRHPEKAADMKAWPAAEQRRAWLKILVRTLASDHPTGRYAAARVLSLRAQPLTFWSEAKLLAAPQLGDGVAAPSTNWSSEKRQVRKSGWLRRLVHVRARPVSERSEPGEPSSLLGRVATIVRFAGGPRPLPVPSADGGLSVAEMRKLTFGVYAGLIRQAAPSSGGGDETHRARRDSVGRLVGLAKNEPSDGQGDAHALRWAVLPVLARALDDAHHLVRKAAAEGLRALAGPGDRSPLLQALRASAPDVGRAALEELVVEALRGDVAAAALVRGALDAPGAAVRARALRELPRLYEKGSLEPWLLALRSQHADVRLAVVDRLVDADDQRVAEALVSALGSDHEDLRLAAAKALALRGDARAAEILGGFLRQSGQGAKDGNGNNGNDDARQAREATGALIALGHARPLAQGAAGVAEIAARTLAARLEDDPDRSADRVALVAALGRVAHPAGDAILLRLLAEEPRPDEDAARVGAFRLKVFETLLGAARKRGARRQGAHASGRALDGPIRVRYDEERALAALREGVRSGTSEVRLAACRATWDLDASEAQQILARLLDDRLPEVRVAACEALAFRAEHVEGATLAPLEGALRGGRRELTLPAAFGLASQRRPEAFQPLLLVLKAGEPAERERAALALGTLGDPRALPHLEALADPPAEVERDEKLGPAAAEALGALLSTARLEGDERRRVATLVERLAMGDVAGVRERALTGLRKGGGGDGRVLLERVLLDGDEPVKLRQHAARELGLLGDVAAEGALAQVFEAPQVALRREAREALARLFPRDRTRQSLLALESPFADLSEPAARYLAQRGDAATLLTRLPTIRGTETRLRLRRGLSRRVGLPTEALALVLKQPDAGARAEAAWLAGTAATRGALEPVVAEAVRAVVADARTAYQGLAAGAQEGFLHGAERGDKALQQARSGEAGLWAAALAGLDVAADARAMSEGRAFPAAVRRAAVRYLSRAGGDGAVLSRALVDADDDVRAAAVAALAGVEPKTAAGLVEGARVPDVATMSPLVRLALKDEAHAARAWDDGNDARPLVLSVLVADRNVAALVVAAKAKGDSAPRLAAIAALGRVGGEEARVALEAILADQKESQAVRAAAFRSLRRLARASRGHARGGKDRGSRAASAASPEALDAEDEEPDDDEEDAPSEDEPDDDESDDEDAEESDDDDEDEDDE